jgi:hypothetical protein
MHHIDPERTGIAGESSVIVTVSKDHRRLETRKRIKHFFTTDIAKMNDVRRASGEQELDCLPRA